MRHLLKKHGNRTFTSLKEMIANKSKEIQEYEKIRGIEFEKHLKQIILDRRVRDGRIRSLSVVYDKICLTAAKPIETMLNQFIQHSKKYDENDLVQTAQYLARAFQISLNDHGGHLDRFGHKLLQGPMFEHFIEEVKYALSDKAYIGPTNVAKVLDSLGKINYVDIQVIRLVTLKIQKMMHITEEEGIKFQPRAYQSEKNNYYKRDLIGLDKELLESEVFQRNLAYFEQKRKEYVSKLTFNNVQKADFENEENYKNIVGLLNSFEKFNKSTDLLIEGVIAVRQQYKKLVTISENQKVMRHPELNSAALAIEEKLLQMHLITFEDIKNPEIIGDEKREQDKVALIIRVLMSEAGIDNFQDYFVEESKDMDYLKKKKQRQLTDFSAVLQSLAKYVNLPYRLEGTDNRITLLNAKWQRFFLEDKFAENNLQVERIFRKAFMETQKFILDNLSTLQLSFIQGGFQSKLRWYSALIELGFLEEASNELKGVKISGEEIQKLSEKQFFIYMKVLNNLYQSDAKPTQQNAKLIEQRLSKIVEKEEYSPNINELCDTINYLYQANEGNQSESSQGIYKKLIKSLSRQVKYIELSPTTNKELAKEAKRILAFEEAEDQNYTGALMQLAEAQNLKDEKSNPYLKLLYDSLNVGQSTVQTPYITTGINDNNQISGVYFANSNCSSIYGKQVSGHISAYCLRLYRKFGVNVQPIALTKFLQVKYEKTMDSVQNVNLKLKNSSEILEIITPYIAKNNQLMADFIKDIGNYLLQVSDSKKGSFRLKKLLSRLKRVASLYKAQKDILLVNQFYTRRCQLLAQFNLLKRDLSILTKEQVEEAQKKLFPNEKNKSMAAILSSLQKELEKPLPKMQEKFAQISQKQKGKQPVFKGKRITLNLLSDGNASQQPEELAENLQIQLLSQHYLLDHRYAEYEDWKKKIKETVNVNQIKLENASDITRVLAMRFCPNLKETIVALPEKNGEFFVPYYPLNWESKYYYHSTQKEEKDRLEEITEGYRVASKKKANQGEEVDRNLIALQNFKHELKVNYSPKQILDTILGLQCVDNLMKTKLNSKEQKNQKQGKFIKRDPKQYFNYLERKSDKLYLQSPYLQYIFNKIEQTETLKEKIKERKENKVKLQMLYNQGVIDRKQYFENVKEVDERLIKELKRLKKKLLTHIDGPQILEDGSKIVQLNKNIDELSRIVSSAQFYDQNQDVDLLLAGGNYEKALEIKRAKAQESLILFKILSLKAQKKQISSQQQKFLSNWKQSVRSGIQKLEIKNQFTKISVANALTAQDKERLSLNSNLVKFAPNLAMSDLILELSLFFDESVLHRLESQIYAEHFSEKYKVSAQAFSASSNKVFKHFVYKAEEAIFDKNAQLNKKELDCIVEMSKIFKTEALSDREKYNIHYKNFKEKLDKINNCKYRGPLAAEYLKQKDSEYYSNYVPQDVQHIKKEETNKLWKSIFEKKQSETTASQIRAKVGQICQRMLFLKLSTPPYFGSLVLEILKHEKTDVYTKEKLIAYTELFKVPLQLDSLDLQGLIEGEQLFLDKIMDSMRRVNGRNFSNSIHALL